MEQESNVLVQGEDGEFSQFCVSLTETIENLKALLEVEFGIPLHQQSLLYNGKELFNHQTLKQVNYISGDLLLVVKRAPPSHGRQEPRGNTSGGVLGGQDPYALRDHIRNDPNLLRQLQNNNPALYEAVIDQDPQKFVSVLVEEERKRKESQYQRMREIEALNADPLNPDNQRKIEELIQRSNIEENMENALEYNPEAFGKVVMLYIDCEVNHTPVKVFVDSGAQSTIMSSECAQRCGIMRLVDKRFSGVAKGVGTAKIIGRVHSAYLKIGSSYFSSSFTILEDSSIDVLLGLDMLRKHQCQIDLKDNVLRVGDESVQFLPEKDIPNNFRHDTPPQSPSLQIPGSPLPNLPPSPNTITIPSAHIPQTTPTPKPSPTPTPKSTPTPTSTPTSVAASNPTVRPPTSQSQFPEADIQTLISLGRSREEALRALQMFNGNVEMAASYLFSLY